MPAVRGAAYLQMTRAVKDSPKDRQCQVCCNTYTEWADYRMPSDFRCERCFTRELSIPLECLFDPEFLRQEKAKWIRAQSW
jgi:hypothetical protein